ncbi:MAG TPA: DNA-primase RepB domain-containing protein [Candidatus Angelobacter sp.]|nr:DNA-primase RepB domain-containing protein [Candidatus Angelobacter sp.]
MTTWDYIRELFQPTDRVAICWKIYTEKRFNQRVVTAETACSERYQSFLRAMNVQGNNIYIGMNPIRPDAGQKRHKEDIAEVRRVYLDIDNDAEAILNRILTGSNLPKPNYVLNTSPGKYQLLWNVRDFERNDAESLMRSLCREFQADPANVDISRVFRLPGLHNKKYDATFQVTAQKLSSAIYTPRDFPSYASSTTPAPRQRATSKLTGTPSHLDWAWVCRQLWNTRDPEAVRSQLTDELERRARVRNKPKPRYYAELTFNKAVAYIAAKRPFSR